MGKVDKLALVGEPFDQYPDLIVHLRNERIRKGLNHFQFEQRSGLAEGHLTKIENFDKGYGRAIGPVTLPLMLGALDLQLVLVKKDNAQDIEKTKETKECLAPSNAKEVMRQMGLMGALARKKALSASKRSEIAKKAAQKRWAKKRKGGKPPNPQS